MKNSGFDKLVKVYCVMVQIISRNFLPSAPSWTEELARYSFIYMVAFGCGVAVLKDEFVFVEFLKDSLEAKGLHQANKIIRILVTFVMLIISLHQVPHGLHGNADPDAVYLLLTDPSVRIPLRQPCVPPGPDDPGLQ